MASAPSPIPSSGGGGTTSFADPASFLGTPGQPQSGASGQGAPGPSKDFVQAMGKISMEMEQKIDALSGQYPEAADDFRTAKMAFRKGIAKIMTTNPEASGGPMAPRSV